MHVNMPQNTKQKKCKNKKKKKTTKQQKNTSTSTPKPHKKTTKNFCKDIPPYY